MQKFCSMHTSSDAFVFCGEFVQILDQGSKCSKICHLKCCLHFNLELFNPTLHISCYKQITSIQLRDPGLWFLHINSKFNSTLYETLLIQTNINEFVLSLRVLLKVIQSLFQPIHLLLFPIFMKTWWPQHIHFFF